MGAKYPSKQFKRWLKTLWHTPGSCCLCQESDTNGLICKYCNILLQSNGVCCELCALPLQLANVSAISRKLSASDCTLADCKPMPDELCSAEPASVLHDDSELRLCAQCVITPPSYRSAIVPWLFQFPVDFIVHELKYTGRLEMGRLAGTLLCEELLGHYEGSALPELVIPVPLTTAKLQKRGFNQAVELLRWFDVDWVNLADADLVWRKHDTAAQSSLKRQARQTNMYDVFGCDAAVAGKTVLLVDDVMTTGSTLEQLTQAVLSAGATSVDVCAFARTPLL